MKKNTSAAGAAKKTIQCACPFCDEELTADKTPLFCTPCKVVLRYCHTCQKAAPQDARVCPDCGGKLS